MQDVARLAGVSIITVSRAFRRDTRIAETTRARVLAAAAEIGYVPNLVAGSLKTRRSGFVAGVIPSLAHSIAVEVTRGMTDALRANGRRLLLADSGFSADEEQELVIGLLARRPDAIFLTGLTHTPLTRRLLRAARIPVVETGNLADEPIDMLVGFSNADAAHTVTRAVLATGRRRIGYIGQVGRDQIERLRDRYAGFRKAIADVDASFDETWFAEVPFTFAGGADALAALLAAAPDIEAVVCSSDILAIGALFECQRRGIAVPGRLAIAGIDDNDLSPQCVPRLSTVRVPRYRIGRVAGEMICRRLAGEAVAEPIVDLGFELMLRDTI